jgi:hypothetical protein
MERFFNLNPKEAKIRMHIAMTIANYTGFMEGKGYGFLNTSSDGTAFLDEYINLAFKIEIPYTNDGLVDTEELRNQISLLVEDKYTE